MRKASLLFVLVPLAAAFGHAWANEKQGEGVPYRLVPIEAYAAFVNNWDGEGTPFCAVVRNLDDWDKVFSPAVTMDEQRPTRPDAALFETELLLVVSRVAPAVEGASPALTVVSLERGNDGCTLVYRFDEPAPASYSVKHALVVAIPDEPGPFRFVEQRPVAVLE